MTPASDRVAETRAARGIMGILAIFRKACRVLFACLVVMASLLVFPNAIAWLIAAWLLA